MKRPAAMGSIPTMEAERAGDELMFLSFLALECTGYEMDTIGKGVTRTISVNLNKN
jgi:hypothetical protein